MSTLPMGRSMNDQRSLPERLRGITKDKWKSLTTDDYQSIDDAADEIERRQAERGKPFFVEGVGFRSPDEAVMHLLAERAQTKAELKRLRGEREQDTARLDWLQQAAEDSVIGFGFELDGGVYLERMQLGTTPHAYRDQDHIRDAIDAARDAAREQGGGEK